MTSFSSGEQRHSIRALHYGLQGPQAGMFGDQSTSVYLITQPCCTATEQLYRKKVIYTEYYSLANPPPHFLLPFPPPHDQWP